MHVLKTDSLSMFEASFCSFKFKMFHQLINFLLVKQVLIQNAGSCYFQSSEKYNFICVYSLVPRKTHIEEYYDIDLM